MAILEAKPDSDDLTELPEYEIDEFDEGGIRKTNGKKIKSIKSEEHYDQDSAKTGRFHNIIRGIWATRQTENVKNRRVFIKTTLRELALYLIFLLLLLLIALLTVNSMTFFYFDSVFQSFVGPYQDPTDGSSMDFNSISDVDSVWKLRRAAMCFCSEEQSLHTTLQVFPWVVTVELKDIFSHGQFMSGLYWNTWYNERNVSFSEKEFIGFDNKLLGVPRLRQLRVSPSYCTVPPKMTQITKACYPDYWTGARSTDPIQPQNGLIPVFTQDA
ncbi:unnamed protein product [Echinostoma caproni]|uniref:PKD_channel domain-containing protein n=1 Tax=Echinostoma caproni TaxID=27848 RepID=A0A183ACS6_9TREM|nr:unnamed protein product [Echinostoma caproni]